MEGAFFFSKPFWKGGNVFLQIQISPFLIKSPTTKPTQILTASETRFPHPANGVVSRMTDRPGSPRPEGVLRPPHNQNKVGTGLEGSCPRLEGGRWMCEGRGGLKPVSPHLLAWHHPRRPTLAPQG